MPNSNFSITRTKIIRAALRRLGNTDPAVQDLANGAFALQNLIKKIDPDGRYLWTISNTETSLTLVTSQRVYTTGDGASNIPTYMMELENFELFIGNSYSPVEILTKRESLQTYNREGTGQPTEVYLEKAASPSANRLHVFPTPDAAYTAKFTYKRFLYDMDGNTENPDLPGHWNVAIINGLTDLLGAEYGLSIADRDYNRGEAKIALDEAKARSAEKVRRSRPLKIKDY